MQYVAEEHTALELDDCARLNVGDCVEVVPSYCPVAVNLHDVYFVVDEGSSPTYGRSSPAAWGGRQRLGRSALTRSRLREANG